MRIYSQEFKNPIIFNYMDHVIYEHDMSALDESYVYKNPILNAKAYNGANSLAGSVREKNEVRINAFYNNGTSETNYRELADNIYSKFTKASETGDRSLAAAVITSSDYTVLQDVVLLGTNEEIIKTGILTGIFEEIATPNLTGKFLSYDNDVQYFTNLAETKSPEPTIGTASTTTVEVPKHGGAVAITDRARRVITSGQDVFTRLVSQLQQKRIKSENELTAEEIETNVGSTLAGGVDFGSRSGSPPASQQNPTDTILAIINYFEGLTTGADWNTVISQGFIFNEYIANDIIKGINAPMPTIGPVNEQASPMQGTVGVTWYRDNTMDVSTNMYVLDRNKALKIFRGPTIAYTVRDPDTETEKYVTKSHMIPKTMDATAIRCVTGVAA